jgi:hypothetical protein
MLQRIELNASANRPPEIGSYRAIRSQSRSQTSPQETPGPQEQYRPSVQEGIVHEMTGLAGRFKVNRKDY